MIYKTKIITPSHIFLEYSAKLVVIPGEEGVFGVMQEHETLVANLKPGVVEISSDTSVLRYFIYGGIAKVTDKEVSITTEFSVNLAMVNKEEVLNNLSFKKSQVLEQPVKYKADILEHDISIYTGLLSFL